MRAFVRGVAAAMAVLAFLVYLGTLAPDVLPGDSGEFQFVAPGLRIVHPTGYPLYLLLGKLTTFIPVGTLAYRVNLFSAICAAFAVAMTFVVSHTIAAILVDEASGTRHTLHRDAIAIVAAASAALIFAFSPSFWLQATEAEVYTLNAAFVASLLLVALQVGSADHRAATGGSVAFALILGLSLAHHRSIILLLPSLAVLLYPYRGLRRAGLPSVAAMIVPLFLYAYTPLRYDASPYTQLRLDDSHVIVSLADTPSAMLGHMLGSGFGGALSWDSVSVQRLLDTPRRLLGELTWPGSALCILGVVALSNRRRWKILTALVIALGMWAVFNAAYHIGDISDYYTPMFLVGAVLIAPGIAFLLQATPSRLITWLVAFVVLLIPVWELAAGYVPRRDDHLTDIRQAWMQILSAGLPTGAVLISNDRDELTPMYYLQWVDGVRPDLFGLFPLISSDSRLKHVVSLIDYVLETPRPIYLTKPMDGLSLKFKTQIESGLVRVMGPQRTTPDHPLLREANGIRFIGWSQSSTTTGDALSIALFWQATSAARPDVTTYVHVVNDDGQTVAQSDHRPGGDFFPSSQWFTNDIVRDEHAMHLPAANVAGKYHLVAGVYLASSVPWGELASIDLGQLPYSH